MHARLQELHVLTKNNVLVYPTLNKRLVLHVVIIMELDHAPNVSQELTLNKQGASAINKA